MGCVFSKYAQDREECAEEYDIIDTLEGISSSPGALITPPMDDDKDAQNQKPSSSLRKGKLMLYLTRLVLIFLTLFDFSPPSRFR